MTGKTPPAARPVVFDGCFGWFHPAPGRRAVVMCSPYGHEETGAHRLWRGLACRLAGAGLPVLRFDYHGSGDAAGAETDPGRLDAWLNSVRAAVRLLRAWTGAEEMALVGSRLGALLAAQVAGETETLDSLVLICPPASGRVLLRELKAMVRLSPSFVGAPPARPEWAGELEVAGHVYTAETQAALDSFDPLGGNRRLASRVLILGRSDTVADGRLAEQLRQAGAAVEETKVSFPDWLPEGPHRARPSEDDFAKIATWLGEGVPPGGLLPPPPPPGQGPRLELAEMVESPVLFGPGDGLVGVLCRPGAALAQSRAPAVLFLNSGANHHIGANRLSVTLARQLAAQGVASLRIDQGGIGDSASLPGRHDNEIDDLGPACADVIAALDLLASAGHHRVLAVGLCSGAGLALAAALGEPRLVGLTLLNLPALVPQPAAGAPASGMRSMEYYLKALRRKETWKRLVAGRLNATAVATRLVRRGLAGLTDQDAVALGRVEDHLRPLFDRGVDLLLVYGLEDQGLPVTERLVGTRGGKLGHPKFRLEVIEGADHNMSQRWVAERLAELLCGQVARTSLGMTEAAGLKGGSLKDR